MKHGYGEGMKRARLATGLRLNRSVSQAAMAELVSAELKRMRVTDKTVSQSAWSDYEAERSEPALIIFRAASRVSGVPEAEVILGSPPDIPPDLGADALALEQHDLDRAAEKSAKPSGRTATPKGGGRRRA